MTGRRQPDTPALDRWRAELAAGTRTRLTMDALREAGGWEQCGLDALALGFTEAAASDVRRARELMGDTAPPSPPPAESLPPRAPGRRRRLEWHGSTVR